MRTKEEAEDYRYFPDPDLPILNINQEKINELKNEIPELPMEKFSRYHKNLSAEDSYNLAGDRELSSFFEETIISK